MKKTGRSAKRAGKAGRSTLSGKFVIGAERFAKISAVEGIALTKQMHGRVAEFDRKGMSNAERREAIMRAHRKG